jgi:hypothetical protein
LEGLKANGFEIPRAKLKEKRDLGRIAKPKAETCIWAACGKPQRILHIYNSLRGHIRSNLNGLLASPSHRAR